MAIAAASAAGLQHTIAAQTWRMLCSCQAVAVAVRSCFASAALGLTVYLSEGCAAAGGQAIVQAALQAVWEERSLLESLEVPQAVLEAAAVEAAARTPSAAAPGEGVSTSCSSIGQQQQQEEVEEEDAGSDSDQGLGFVDDYLKAPAVTAPVRPAVVYVTVPALPRG
jgi:hypothetical protein